MAYVTLDAAKLKKNFDYLENLFRSKGISWAVVSKMLCGNKTFLQVLIDMGVRSFCDSRVSNLKTIKTLCPEARTAYIKPPPKRFLENIVRYADISFNTERDTIERLSAEAVKQGKKHQIIIMIELGELREGVLQDDVVNFYENVFKLPNIEVIGLGTNLTCMYGVLPSHDKLIQLSLFKQLIEARFNRNIRYVSGGSSVTIPLIFENLLPAGVNHFRVGETLYLGTDVYHAKTYDAMQNDVFKLHAEIIELTRKPNRPIGELGRNLKGEEVDFDPGISPGYSLRAILDVGLLDIDENHVWMAQKDLKLVGASSDMLVVDLGKNPRNYKIGDLLEFRMDYMGLLRLMNSRYIGKKVIGKEVLAQT